jgi:4-hydroxy 2-oxovalerate aldolase
LELIDEINKLDVYCLAIVDTFGSITQAKLAHLFRLIDHNLNPAIRIGYHAHNNLQLAFANAIEIINLHGKRDIVLDCSCYGIGRGAGNLPTELIVNYLNQQQGEEIYNLSPILDTIDLDILPIFREKAWGYSSHHALSGMLDLHPNYATFLFNQQRLTVAAIQEILACIEKDKQVNYDERYISELYRHHQAKLVNDDSSLKTIQANLRNTILFVAPGASTKEHLEKIEAFIREENPLVVAINFEPQQIKADYLFFGNQLRFDQYARAASTPVLVSSNINVGNADVAVINYADLISKTQTTEIDNSGLMALRLFLRVGATSFNLAGFDGFSVNQNNYADDVQSFFSEAAIIANRNLAIIKQLDEIKKTANVTFFTPSIYKDSI